MKTQAAERSPREFPLRSANGDAWGAQGRSLEAALSRLDDGFAGLTDAVQYSYRGFMLRCKPQPTPSGRFLAYVVILCHLRGLHTVGAVTADLPSFAEHIDAVCAGLAAGRKWVDLNCAEARSGGDKVDDDLQV